MQESSKSGPIKRKKYNINDLPLEEFTQEILRRYEQYKSQPVVEKKVDVNLLTTKAPTFPKASPRVWNTSKYVCNTSVVTRPVFAAPLSYSVKQDLSWVEKEIEVGQQDQAEVAVKPDRSQIRSTVIKLIEKRNDEDHEQFIMIKSNNTESIVRLEDFYKTLTETEQTSGDTIQVITDLLKAGEEIEIREEEDIVEIQNV